MALDPADSGGIENLAAAESRCSLAWGTRPLAAIMLGAGVTASVYLADGPLWGPVVAAAVGAGTD